MDSKNKVITTMQIDKSKAPPPMIKTTSLSMHELPYGKISKEELKETLETVAKNPEKKRKVKTDEK